MAKSKHVQQALQQRVYVNDVHESLLTMDPGRLSRPKQQKRVILSEFQPNRLVGETPGKSLSSRLVKSSTTQAKAESQLQPSRKKSSFPLISAEDAGFIHFLQKHSTSQHKRVNAGGRIVSMNHISVDIAEQLLADESNDVQLNMLHLDSSSPQVPQPVENGSDEHECSATYAGSSASSDIPLQMSLDVRVRQPVLHPYLMQNPNQVQHRRSMSNVIVYEQRFPGGIAMSYFPQHIMVGHLQTVQSFEMATTNAFSVPIFAPGASWYVPEIQLAYDLLPITRLSVHHWSMLESPNMNIITRGNRHIILCWMETISRLVAKSMGIPHRWYLVWDLLKRHLTAIKQLITEVSRIIALTEKTSPYHGEFRMMYITMKEHVEEQCAILLAGYARFRLDQVRQWEEAMLFPQREYDPGASAGEQPEGVVVNGTWYPLAHGDLPIVQYDAGVMSGTWVHGTWYPNQQGPQDTEALNEEQTDAAVIDPIPCAAPSINSSESDWSVELEPSFFEKRASERQQQRKSNSLENGESSESGDLPSGVQQDRDESGLSQCDGADDRAGEKKLLSKRSTKDQNERHEVSVVGWNEATSAHHRNERSNRGHRMSAYKNHWIPNRQVTVQLSTTNAHGEIVQASPSRYNDEE
ncbi:hypothetical protein N7490_001092 [Penicillium lividum]|nr:hypothetical protein N7490_001092 [Penicillium lividum]